MIHHLRANLWLVVLSLLICCVAYPAVLLGIGQTVFSEKAQGSLIVDHSGNVIGSRLIAQPFTSDQYFQPRPSVASYNGASGASNFGASNCQLRDRVAQALGPIVKYAGDAKNGKAVGPDIEAWFAETDRAKAKNGSGVLSQWADAHPTAAQNWVGTSFDEKNPTLQQQYVLDWQKTHANEVADWIKQNPTTPNPPHPADLAVPFFKNLSDEHPGKILSSVDDPAAAGKKKIDLIASGSDVQSLLFDMWLGAHPDAELQQVPGDLVTTSGSGLDPDITLDNAEYQLDPVAGEWANKMKRESPDVRKEIEAMLQERASAPLDGLVGVKLINVLEINLALMNRYEPAAPAAK